MKKYIQVVKVTLQEYSVYRLNFLLWRFRGVVQLLVLYFLWQAAIPQGVTIFGYDQSKILTYILGTSIIRAFALSSRSVDAAGQIATGDISNFLIKPISYIKYWFAKDVADKFLNLFFSVVEISLIIFILKPPIIFQPNFLLVLLTLLAIAFGIMLYFYLSFALSLIAFWTPESPWPLRFLFTIIMEFLAGGLFPLNILPQAVFNVLKFLPFSYVLFFPLNVYLGNLSYQEIFMGLGIAIFWIVIIYQTVKIMFKAGLKEYAAWGR
ncbi:MAG: ABC-2 family transporter protein [bacterium]|nr:ABC-2 family transporter protein [bacterium]